MAISYEVPRSECEKCGADLICIDCNFPKSDHVLGISSGQRDILLDMLRFTKDGETAGTVTMHAADKVDLLDLLEKVEAL